MAPTDHEPPGRPITPVPLAPRQARSAATLERILDAVEQLLGARTVDQIRLDHIVDLAGVSRSSFYARFRTKDEVFAKLHERFENRALAELGAVDATVGHRLPTSLPPEDIVAVLVGRYPDFIEANRRLLLAFEQYPLTRAVATRSGATDEITRIYCEVVGRSDPPFVEAVAFASRAVAAILMRRLLDQPLGPLDQERDALLRETTRMVVAYLSTVPPA